MEEIEVGEYVRIAGEIIAKVTNKNRDCILIDRVVKDPIRQEGTIRDWAIFNNEKRLIVKHSKNIIDLIEIYDYVNGLLVFDIISYVDGIKRIKLANGVLLRNEDIETVLTHEQFSSMEYKVEE